MSNILSYTISSEHECFEQAMLYEHIFLIISYTWRNSYFFNNIGRVEAVAHSARSISSWRTGFSDAEFGRYRRAKHRQDGMISSQSLTHKDIG